MSERVEQRWPDGLRERVVERAGPRGVTQFTVRAVEAALDGLTPERVREVAERSREAGRKLDVAMERAQEVLDDPVLYRCPNDCDPAWRPRSPSARCPSCGRTAIAT